MNIETIENWDIRYEDNAPVRTPSGLDIYYEINGAGPPLTIVSNFFLASVAWRNFTTQLRDRHRLLTYDLRNQGASSEGDGSFENHVADLEAVLDAAGLESTYLLGTSISTQICRDFAVAHPDRVRGLLLCGPTIHPSGSRRRKFLVKAWLDDLDRGGLGSLFDNFFPLVFSDRIIETGGTPVYLGLRERFLAVNSTAQLVTNMRGAAEAVDSPEKLRAIDIPVLLFTGDSDYLAGPRALHEAKELLRQASIEIIENCGHSPYVEATAQFEAIVERFVGECERSR